MAPAGAADGLARATTLEAGLGVGAVVGVSALAEGDAVPPGVSVRPVATGVAAGVAVDALGAGVAADALGPGVPTGVPA